MADKLTPERRSENMRRIKSKGMKPELLVRSLVHGMGYRYRLHKRDLPGKPDLVFGPRRKAIFVHGCFWHGHDDPACRDGRAPRSNESYWLPKLTRNKERDAASVTALEAVGWHVLVVWECETRDAETLRTRLENFLGRPSATQMRGERNIALRGGARIRAKGTGTLAGAGANDNYLNGMRARRIVVHGASLEIVQPLLL